jgi:hypothetical protein
MQPSDLESTVSRQSWEWLFDLPSRLNVVIEVIDDRHMPMFPAGTTAVAVTLRRMLIAGDPPLVSAVSDVLRLGTPAALVVDRLQVLCVGLSPAGVLMLARQLETDDSSAASREDLERIGSWLAAAIEASLIRPSNGVAVEPYRIASLQRILSDAVSRGSVRTLIGGFVEGLGVWDDVLIRSYAVGAHGGLFQYVSPVGTTKSLPAELDDAVVPRDGRMVRLSRDEVARLGLASPSDDVLILGLLSGADIACVLVFSGSIDGHEQVRLTLYSDMLRESLHELLAATTNRVIAELTPPRLPLEEPLEDAARKLLGRLTAVLGASQGALVVSPATGPEILSIGDRNLLPTRDHELRPDRLVVRSSDAGRTMTVVLGRDQPRFASFEREIVQAGVTALQSRMEGDNRGAAEKERRQRFRPVDVLFDQLAAEALDAGQQVSVIVASVDATATAVPPGFAQTWLGATRAHLRAGDFAGILSDTEIAVLLCDASPEHAALVSSRLKQLIESQDGTGLSLRTAFGMTTRLPTSPFEGSLVGVARAGASLGPLS